MDDGKKEKVAASLPLFPLPIVPRALSLLTHPPPPPASLQHKEASAWERDPGL